MITKKLFKIVVQSQLRTGLMDSVNGMLFERFEDAELYVDRLLNNIVLGKNCRVNHDESKHFFTLNNEPCYRRQILISEVDKDSFHWFYLYELCVYPHEIFIHGSEKLDEGAS